MINIQFIEGFDTLVDKIDSNVIEGLTMDEVVIDEDSITDKCFNDCTINEIYLGESSLTNLVFNNCIIKNLVMDSQTKITSTIFNECIFDNCDFKYCNSDIKFINCRYYKSPLNVRSKNIITNLVNIIKNHMMNYMYVG